MSLEPKSAGERRVKCGCGDGVRLRVLGAGVGAGVVVVVVVSSDVAGLRVCERKTVRGLGGAGEGAGEGIGDSSSLSSSSESSLESEGVSGRRGTPMAGS